MKTAERQHLKHNEVADLVSRFKETMDTAGPSIGRAALAALAVLLVVGGFFGWRSYAATKSQGLLAEALTVDQAPIVPPPAPAQPGQPAPQAPPAGSFPTEQARREAALAKFVAAADAYPSTDAGRMARYRAASLYAEMGKLAEAEREFKAVSDSGAGSSPRWRSLGLADIQVRQGQFDPAIATFKDLSTRADGNLPVDGILMQLGRAQALAGKTSDAVQTFKRVADEFPQSRLRSRGASSGGVARRNARRRDRNHTTWSSSNSGMASLRAVSMPRCSVIWALGQPTQLPVSRTVAPFSCTLTSSTSPPSAWSRGRTLPRTPSTFSRETMFEPLSRW